MKTTLLWKEKSKKTLENRQISPVPRKSDRVTKTDTQTWYSPVPNSNDVPQRTKIPKESEEIQKSKSIPEQQDQNRKQHNSKFQDILQSYSA